MSHFVRPRPAGDYPLRFIALHHAGGSAAGYHPLARELPADWEVLLLDLPGRGRRYAEAPHREMTGVVDEATRLIADQTGRPYVLFGHSMGAVVAVEVGRRLAVSHSAPAWVGVSGRAAPTAPPPVVPVVPGGRLSELADDRLLAVLLSLGGTPRRLLEMPEMRAQFLRVARADLLAVDSYRAAPGRPPLPCPLTVFGGLTDPWAPLDHLPAWQAESRLPLRQCFFPGGHFYFQDDAFARLAREIRTEVRAALRGDAAPAGTGGHEFFTVGG